jgi:hypothetical protein
VVIDANKDDEEFAEEHKERVQKHQNELDGAKEKNIEHIEIKKTGKIIRKKIDHSLNKDKEAKIADILKKNNCTDIFRDAFIKNEQELYENNRLGKFTKYKFSKKSRDQMYNKLELLLSLRLFGGMLFLRLLMYKI